ncbi:MAG: BPSL0067 family protein [Spirosomataceae bacterium]
MSYKLSCAVEECTDDELNVYEENEGYSNSKGNHECVVFVQGVTQVPATVYWTKGKKVQDAKEGEILRGTAIATFDENDKYPTDSKGRHAAIYVRHNHDYILVYDQWNKQGMVKKRKIRFNVKDGTSRSNDGKTFYVIEAITQ